MSDRAALYASVCASPEDDTARLVFADWLEENGDAKRAKFIRAAVEMKRREEADSQAADVYHFLDDNGSFDAHDPDWSELDPELGDVVAAAKRLEAVELTLRPKGDGLPKIRGVSFGDVERGFYTGITVERPAALLANAGEIFRAAPISRVRIEQLDAGQAREFVDAGHLARVRHLALSYDVQPEAIRVLGNHPDAAGVARLELDGGEDGFGQFEALAAGKHWTGVTLLDLMDVNDGEADDRMAAALRRPVFRGLRHFAAWGNDLGDRTARAIATAGLTELRYLDLAINEITDDGAAALAASKKLPNLRYLDVGTNDCTGPGAAELIVTPRLSKLTVLRADGVRGPDPKVLAKPGRGPMLRVLILEGGRATARGMAALASNPAVRGVWYLSLEWSELTDSSLAGLTMGGEFEKLTLLNLSGNPALTAKAAASLANWRCAASLRWLQLHEVKFGDAGAKALAESPHLGGLKTLGYSGGGTARLRKRFGKQVLP